VIVKPDVPITPIDSSFWNDAQNSQAPMIAASYSDFGGLRATYLFLYAQGTNVQAAFHLSDAGITQPAFLYDYIHGTGRVVDPSDLLNQPVDDFAYLIAAPIGSSRIAILGDAGQFATLGKKRIVALTDNGEAAQITVAFAPGETVRTITGYSPFPVQARAADGAVGHILRNQTTGLFSVQVFPGAFGAVTITIAPWLHELPAARR